MNSHEFIDGLIEWLKDPSNYWIMKYCVQYGIYDERLAEMCEEDEYVADRVKLARSIERNKLMELAAESSAHDAKVFLKALETQHNWKGDALLTSNTTNNYGNSADEAVQLLRGNREQEEDNS